MTGVLLAGLVVGVVTYRIWRVFALDTITDGVRVRVPWWAEYWLTCPWCSTVWYGGAVTYSTAHFVEVTAPLLVWPIAVTVAGWLGTADRRFHERTFGDG